VNASTYPMDPKALAKGHNYDLSSLIPHPKGCGKYSLALLKLRDQMQAMADDAGLTLSLIIRGDMIRCLTDSEAAQYHDRAAGNAVSKLGRNLRMMCQNVDASALTDDERREHQQSINHRALQYLAVRKPITRLRQDAARNIGAVTDDDVRRAALRAQRGE
jgi:hypothetical protein